jgi:hypothetical protein
LDFIPVTSKKHVTASKSTERKRRQRQREVMYEREDWHLFLDPTTLPQKAGCSPFHLNQIVLKELADNALDTGANVSLEYANGQWVVCDDGPGINPAIVPKLFSVNRSLLSSKLKRLPSRGMLGNGLRVVMGAAAVSGGCLIVETRGHRLRLATESTTGETTILSDEPIPRKPGTTVYLSLAGSTYGDRVLAQTSIQIAKCGKQYHGPSSLWWYGHGDLHRLFANASPTNATVGEVCRDLGVKFDDLRTARSITKQDVEAILEKLCGSTKPVAPQEIGFIGREFQSDWPGYAQKADLVTTQSGAQIPCVVEAWAICSRASEKGQGSAAIQVIINRSMTLASLHANCYPSRIYLSGCDLRRKVEGPGTGDYEILLSVIAPYMQLAGDGKEPVLRPFGDAIAYVIRKACGAAHRAMAKPVRCMSIKDAAWSVMAEAYQVASGNGRYPANARQTMYAARPMILALTRTTKLDDRYFTQTLLPDYTEDHPEETEEWDVVFDARGTFIEPHTGKEIGLGTLEVREYLGDRPRFGPAVELAYNEMFSTTGPTNRYSNVLFIEKEGFAQLLRAARIAERFDIAIMSTKGMSTTAARMHIDGLSPHIANVLVLHDFDVTGFSIFGTLGTDSRRFRFKNRVSVIDIGLRLNDVESLSLQSEPVQISGNWDARAATLAEHGATRSEISFLRERRVELNAMTAPVFVAFLERKLVEHGVSKLVPDAPTVERHARRIVEQQLAERAMREILPKIHNQAESVQLPENLRDEIRDKLQQEPEIPWDKALADIAEEAGWAAE